MIASMVLASSLAAASQAPAPAEPAVTATELAVTPTMNLIVAAKR